MEGRRRFGRELKTRAARRPIVPYTDALVRPGINQHEIPFDVPLGQGKAVLFKKLLFATTADKVRPSRA